MKTRCFPKKIGSEVLMVCATAFAALSAAEAPAEVDWRAAATAAGLDADARSRLEADGVLVAEATCKQSFIPYIGDERPVFVTADSLLNGYHVLFAESIRRLEIAQAAEMPGVLDHLLARLESAATWAEGRPELVAAARRRATLVLGVARRLLDDAYRCGDTELDRPIGEAAARVVAAEGTGLPAWLGEPGPDLVALDYGRYRPRGFYATEERLRRFFRALSWLQSIPFRVDSDEELLAVLLLGKALLLDDRTAGPEHLRRHAFFSCYRDLLGAGDDWDLTKAGATARDWHSFDLDRGHLERVREHLLRFATREGGSAINDQLRFAPTDPTAVAEPDFRVVSAHRLPSAVLFQRSADRRRFDRPFPDGLEVAAALGSRLAREVLPGGEREAVLAVVDRYRPCFIDPDRTPRGHHRAYLAVLAELLDPPEPDAPAFMHGDAWRRKVCNAALASWAQSRHTWALQAKQTVHFLGMSMVPPGFVEPDPDFFGALADLAQRTAERLEPIGSVGPDYAYAIRAMERMRRLLDGVANAEQLNGRFDKIKDPQEGVLLDLAYGLLLCAEIDAKRDTEAYYTAQRAWLAELIAACERSDLTAFPAARELLDREGFAPERLWARLERLARRLQVLAHKQLRGVPFDADEVRLITDYGAKLAGIMLYGGNAYLDPRDDAPRIVDVYANPEVGILHVGVARPRRLYVLYPWDGKRVLCVGAVLPYHQFVAPRRLTDAEWRKRLDGDERPAVPTWFAPLLENGEPPPP